MEGTNENPPGERGAGELRSHLDNGADSTTLLNSLRAEYPVFNQYLPLVIGIQSAVSAALPDAHVRSIGRALAMHCHTDRYLRSIVAGGPRYALDATVCGEVSVAQRVAAVLVLARRADRTRRAGR